MHPLAQLPPCPLPRRLHGAVVLRLLRGLSHLFALMALACLLALGLVHGARAQQVLTLTHLQETGEPMDLAGVLALPEHDWLPSPAHGPNLGYSDKTHWFRSAVNPADGHTAHLLEIEYPVLDHIELHLRTRPAAGTPGDTATPWRTLVLGDKLPFAERPLSHPNFVVPVEIPPGHTLELLARVTTSSSVQFPLLLWTPESFQHHTQASMLLLGGYVGLMLGLLIYNLVLWVTVRERTYLLYVVWVASIAGCVTALKGLTFQYLWPQATQWNDTAIVVLLALTGASAPAFAAEFIKLTPGPRWRAQSVRVITGLSLLVAAAALVLPYSLAIRSAIASSVLAIFVLTTLALLRAREGYPPARVFLLAFGAVLAGGVLLAMDKFGLVARNMLTENALQIGSALEVLMISLGLATRLNQERMLRELAQAQALHAQQDAREQLEARVTARTQELELVNRKLAELSMTDGLTGIPNRRFLDDTLARALAEAAAQGRTLSLALVDVDHFKQFNDNHGHLCGDECLRVVAQALQRQAHRTRDLVARFGGEEFCVVMPNAGPEGALTVAERMRSTIEALSIPTACGAVGITVSVGVCCVAPKGVQGPAELQALVRKADDALYRAKRTGRNRVVMTADAVEADAATEAAAP